MRDNLRLPPFRGGVGGSVDSDRVVSEVKRGKREGGKRQLIEVVKCIEVRFKTDNIKSLSVTGPLTPYSLCLSLGNS